MTVIERFLKLVAYETTSDESTGTCPSTPGQKVLGAELVRQMQELGIADGETTDDGLFTLKNVACLGCCSLSPVMMINGETYGSLTPSKTVEILRKLKEEG